MAPRSRTGQRDTATRGKLLDVTAEIMVEEGYAAATSRKVADKAGVQRALVYYYFPTMDDLYLALLRRGSQAIMDAQRRALEADKPLQALWDMTVDPRGTQLLLEFMALGNHRDAIRRELATGAERFHEAQVAALTLILRRHSEQNPLPPEVVSVLIASIGRFLVLEGNLGITKGHQATREAVGEYIRRFDVPRELPSPRRPDALGSMY